MKKVITQFQITNPSAAIEIKIVNRLFRRGSFLAGNPVRNTQITITGTKQRTIIAAANSSRTLQLGELGSVNLNTNQRLSAEKFQKPDTEIAKAERMVKNLLRNVQYIRSSDGSGMGYFGALESGGHETSVPRSPLLF